MPGKKKLGGRGLSHGARQLQVATLSVAQLPLQGVPARNRVRPAHSDNGSDRDECSDGSEMPGQGSVGNDDDDAEDSESVHFLWQAKKGLDHQSHLPCLRLWESTTAHEATGNATPPLRLVVKLKRICRRRTCRGHNSHPQLRVCANATEISAGPLGACSLYAHHAKLLSTPCVCSRWRSD